MCLILCNKQKMKSIVGEGDRKPDKETVCEFFFMVKSKQSRKILDLLENSFLFFFSINKRTPDQSSLSPCPSLLSDAPFTIPPILNPQQQPSNEREQSYSVDSLLQVHSMQPHSA